MDSTGFNRRGLLVAGAVGAVGAGTLLAGCATSASSADASASTADSTGLPNLTPNPVIDVLAAQRVLPVLRDSSPESAMRTAQAWIEGGCRAVELTTTTPDVFHVAMMLAKERGTVGVGTLHKVQQADQAADAGASYALSFATWPGLIARCQERGLMPVPGTMTPSEVYVSLAAPLIKIFPASLLGPAYVTTLRVLLPGLRTQVTGGIGATPQESRAWLDAGATVVGVDGDMFGTSAGAASQVRDYLAAVAG